MKVFTTHLVQNLMIKMKNIKNNKTKIQTQNQKNIFDYLKRLSQETKDLMDEIKDANDNIDIYKLVFIGSNKKRFNFNTFRVPLNFLSAIYNGKFSLKRHKLIKEIYRKK